MTEQQTKANIVTAILHHAVTRPDAPCMDYDGRLITYGQLSEMVFQWAQAMRRQGLTPDERVGIVFRDFIDDVVARLAVMSIGAIPGSLDVFAKPQERAPVLERYGMSRVIEGAGCYSGLAQAIRVDDSWIADTEAGAAEERCVPASDGAAQIIFTSGTSGVPVGAVQGHMAIQALKAALSEKMQGTATRFMSLSWASTAAGAYLPLTCLLEGGCVLFRPLMRDHEAMMQSLNDDEISVLFAPPNLIPGMVALARDGGIAPCFPKLRSLIIGSAASAPDMLLEARHWLTPGIVHVYGAGTIGMAARQTGEDLVTKPESVGRALKGVDAQIVDENDQPLPAGSVGRLRLRSAMVASHLIGEASSQADRALNGWNYPGDLAMLDDDGFLYLAGREGDLINSGGMKIYPLEVETALARCPGVREIAVVGAPCKKDGQTVVAFVVAEPGLTELDLETASRQTLPTWKRPSRFILAETLPRNASGKVMKRDLLAQLAG